MITKPLTVGAVRGLLYAIALAVLGTVIDAMSSVDFGRWRWAPVVAMVARVVEAVLLDRHQSPQAGLLGGAPAGPTAAP